MHCDCCTAFQKASVFFCCYNEALIKETLQFLQKYNFSALIIKYFDINFNDVPKG